MSEICTFSCGETVSLGTLSYYDPCEPQTMKYPYARLVIMACDNPDLTAGVCLPCGTVSIGSGSGSEIDAGCGIKLPGVFTYPITYETLFVDPDGNDGAFMKQFAKDASKYRVAIVYDNGMAITDEGAHPGFRFSVSSPPQFVEGENGLAKWSLGLSIETSGGFGPEPNVDADAICATLDNAA